MDLAGGQPVDLVHAHIVGMEAKRLSRLVENLLAYSRITDIADTYAFDTLADLANEFAAVREGSAQEREAEHLRRLRQPELCAVLGGGAMSTELGGIRVKGKLGFGHHPMLEHFKFLKSVAKRTPKFTMPSPAMRGTASAAGVGASVAEAIANKLTERHPHVFADARFVRVADTPLIDFVLETERRAAGRRPAWAGRPVPARAGDGDAVAPPGVARA